MGKVSFHRVFCHLFWKGLEVPVLKGCLLKIRFFLLGHLLESVQDVYQSDSYNWGRAYPKNPPQRRIGNYVVGILVNQVVVHKLLSNLNQAVSNRGLKLEWHSTNRKRVQLRLVLKLVLKKATCKVLASNRKNSGWLFSKKPGSKR